MDALIAATRLARDLALATRNDADFDGLGIALDAPCNIARSTGKSQAAASAGRHR